MMPVKPGDTFVRFAPNGRREGETVQQFVQRNQLTPEQTAWPQTQPVRGNPSLQRLSMALADAGFDDIHLRLSGDGEDVSFKVRLTERVMAQDSDELLRLWIATFRQAGFRVGFEEIGFIDVDGTRISGHTLVGPIDEIAEHGAPQIEI
jgi:hypothetical protein